MLILMKKMRSQKAVLKSHSADLFSFTADAVKPQNGNFLKVIAQDLNVRRILVSCLLVSDI